MRLRSHSRKIDSYLQKSTLSSAHAPPPSPGSAFARFPLLLSVLFAVFEFDQHRIADACRSRVGDGMEKLLLLEKVDGCHCGIRFGVCGIQSL